MFLWICCRVDKLIIILFHDFNAVAFPNMKQSTSCESSATLMDENNMYPLNGSPMPDFTALLDEWVYVFRKLKYKYKKSEIVIF